jgi:hypothetical protein
MAKTAFVATRLEPSEYQEIQRAAERYYEGNTSMLFRQALRLGLRQLEQLKAQTPRPLWPGRDQDE